MGQPLRLAKDEPDSFVPLKEEVNAAIARMAMANASDDH